MELTLLTNIVKIKLVREGYLPNYPYHLIADDEMCEAFLSQTSETGYFFDNYPCLSDKVREPYDVLVNEIRKYLALFCLPTYHKSKIDKLPDWVESYMLGTVLSINSDPLDVHELLVGLGCDNLEDEFTEAATIGCYNVSKIWTDKYPSKLNQRRPPTMFGEPHVMKAIRLSQGIMYTNGYVDKVATIVEGE